MIRRHHYGARPGGARPGGAQPGTARAGLPALAGALVCVVSLLSAPYADAGTTIYRTVDENGNVVFTDVPPKSNEQGAAVKLGDSNSFTPPPGENRQPTGRSVEEWLDGDSGDSDQEPAAGGYASLKVASPANDAAVRDNAGNVTVTASVEPELASDHVMQLYLDGTLRQSGPTTSFQLTNLDRGSHDVELRIVDQGGNVLASSGPSVFHLQRRSVLLQPAKGNSTNQ